MIHHAYVTLTLAFHSTMLILLSQPLSPMCPSQSRAVSDPYMAVHIKHCQDLESLPTLREKGHQIIFLHLITISWPLISHLTHPHFTFDPSPFHIEPMLFFTFHFPFIPTLSYHLNPLHVHSNSSDHWHTIRTTISCSYIFSQWISSTHLPQTDSSCLLFLRSLKTPQSIIYLCPMWYRNWRHSSIIQHCSRFSPQLQQCLGTQGVI